jgi:hypothetical protein
VLSRHLVSADNGPGVAGTLTIESHGTLRDVNLPDGDAARIRAARQDAVELGYMLIVDEAFNIEPVKYMAFAGPHLINQAATARFLTYGHSAAETAEAGVRILRGIVQDGDPWPEP